MELYYSTGPWGRPLAVDVTVRHTWSASRVGVGSAASVLGEAVRGKHRHYDGPCTEVGIDFRVVAFNMWGGFESEGGEVLNKWKALMGKADGEDTERVQADFHRRVSFAVMKEVAR